MPTPGHASITGLILAGGLGRRMGGADKGLQLLMGRPLVAWVIERLAPQVSSMAINANRNGNAYAAFGKPVWPDRVEGFVGPLAGLHAGLAECRTEFLVCVPCDTPHLPHDLVSRLHAGLLDAGTGIAVAHAGQRLQPTFALMKPALKQNLEAFLAQGGRSASAWLGTLDFATVCFDDERAFDNLNTPDDLQRAAVGK